MGQRYPVHAAATVAVLVALAVGAAPAADGASAAAAKGSALEGVSARLARAVESAERTRRSIAGAGAKAAGPRADVVLATHAGVTRAELARTGVEVIAHTARYGRATVNVPDRAALERLAALPGVRMVRSTFGYRRRDGAVISRGVEAMEVDGVGGLDGSGVTVGILSDSISRTTNVVDEGTTTFNGNTAPGTSAKSSPVTMKNSFPQQSGDLPPKVEILQDDASGSLVDEGAAMAELVHDLAPGANVFFHTAAGGGIAGFADAIDDLCDPRKGVDVVVDDIGFRAELMYQRDVISAAAEDCVERGVAFFSAAGNAGDRAFRVEFDDLLAADDEGRSSVFRPTEQDFHNWAGGDPYLRVELPASSRVTAVLQWNQPALSVPANSNNGPRIDLDLLAFDRPTVSSAILNNDPDNDGVPNGSSVLDQVASDPATGLDPLEIVEFENTSSGPRTVFLVVDHWAGEQETIPQADGTPLEFRLVFFESGGSSDIEYLNSASGPDAAPSMYGHTVATGVQSVGAVPWFDTPAFPGKNTGSTSRIDPELFTARGGALGKHFKPDGSFRRGTQHPQPRIAASDGNNTTFFGTPWPQTRWESEAGESDQPAMDDGFPNFFGTSAAAPQAAAVAALLLEAEPSLAPVDIAAKLQASATDVDGANAAGGCDDRTGSGLVNAAAAVTASDRPPRADAGGDREGESGDTITLDGSASRDNNGIAAYRWRQVAGRPVDLSNPTGAQTDLTIPNTSANLAFELRVSDAACLSDADRVTVKVKGGGGGGTLGGGLGILLALCLAGRRRGRSRAP